MLVKSVSLSLVALAANLVVAMPAAAQARSDGSGQLPAPCRVSANDEGSTCGSGLGRIFPNRGARPAHAILFFGGSGVRLERDRPSAATQTTGPAERGCPLPTLHPQPQKRPVFTLSLRHD